MVDLSFIKFLLRWIASNLAIPFWVVGHVHLTMNVYKDVHEIIASFGMNIIVIIGIWLDWKEFKEQKTHHTRKFLKR
jgi:ABC-type nickel/cobalt efflux system permease component RcnA